MFDIPSATLGLVLASAAPFSVETTVQAISTPSLASPSDPATRALSSRATRLGGIGEGIGAQVDARAPCDSPRSPSRSPPPPPLVSPSRALGLVAIKLCAAAVRVRAAAQQAFQPGVIREGGALHLGAIPYYRSLVSRVRVRDALGVNA